MSSAVVLESQSGTATALYEAWKEIADLENKRASFFQDLFIQGYVVDSLEVPKTSKSEDVETFIEVELKDMPKLKNTDYGRVVFKTKHLYTGNFSDWKFQGPGRYVWIDGTVYQGEFVDGLMSGQGTIVWLDGCIYEGSFVNGTRCGWGLYVLKDGFSYQGDWVDGLPHGIGKIWFNENKPDEDYYEGSWVKGYRNGIGTRQYSNGDRYYGNWVDGERSGEGTMVWLKDRQIYRGQWLNGLPQGSGKHIWFLDRSTRGSGAAFPTRHVYFGDWEEGLRHGIGKMIYPCGSTYEGRWAHGQRQGKGIYMNPAGDLIVGLFKVGNLVGGSDVPLHAPTYEYDYGGLVEWLTSKFKLPIDSEPVEERQLADITLKYLSQLRQLYARAGNLAHAWGHNGIFPHWKKNDSSSEAAHMHGRTEKFHSPDGVHPVTRFGLWLLLKDIPGFTEYATLAYFDKHFVDTPTISFQTRHNPFEPVYLWQFLQCLVIAAIAYYVEIPERNARVNESNNTPHEPNKPAPAQEDSLSAPETESMKSIISIPSKIKIKIAKTKSKGKKMESVAPPPTGSLRQKSKKKVSPGAKNPSPLVLSPPEGKKEAKKSGDTTLTPHQGQVNFKEDEEETAEVPVAVVVKPKTLIDKRKSMRSGAKKSRKSVAPLIPVVPRVEIVLKPEDEEKEGTGGGVESEYDEEEGLEEETESQIPSELINIEPELEDRWDDEALEDDEEVLGEWTPYWKRPRKVRMMCIYEAFDKFLREMLIPCLNRSAGDNLPQVPTPLPPLPDLWNSFESLHAEREWIYAREFIHSLVPDSTWPAEGERLYWHRNPEILSAKIDLDALFNLSVMNTQRNEGGGLLTNAASESEFLGSAGDAGRMIQPVTTSAINLEIDDAPSDATLTRMKQASVTDFLTDPVPFAEEELVPAPFLWIDKPKLIRVPRRKENFANLEMLDVSRVLRNLYPKLLNYGSPEDTSLNFEMIFCDWLLGVCECAKVSADRELRPTVDPALRIWPSDEEEDEEYELSSAEECYEDEYCEEEE